jgi:hypothetical protein
MYPPPPTVTGKYDNNKGKEDEHPHLTNAKKYISRAALEAGSPITWNGPRKKGLPERRAVCGHHHRKERKSTAMPVTEDMRYREVALVNNRKNNRKEGKNMPKMVKIVDKSPGKECGFRHTIKWDKFGIYVELERQSGVEVHNDHPMHFDPKCIPMPTRLLSAEEAKDIKNHEEVTHSKASARNFSLKQFGRFLSRAKIQLLADAEKSKEGKADIERMIKKMEESDDVMFQALSDVPFDYLDDGPENKVGEGAAQTGAAQTKTVSTLKENDGTITNTSIKELPSISNLEGKVKKEREERQLSASDVLFISIAWTFLPALRFFLLCPEVLWCDVTSHSNNKGYHLLTFSCRTSLDKQVVFLWVWIPNQRRFSFRQRAILLAARLAARLAILLATRLATLSAGYIFGY